MTAIPDDRVEEVRSEDSSGLPPHDLLDWLGEECLGLEKELALTFEQGERLAAALKDVFDRMSDEELSARFAISRPACGLGAFRITALLPVD
ncbi:MAG: hypothetical protein ACJ72M_01615 [Propionibacteriaceae bacterium]|jgi:Flp pilus assembly protein TadB